MAGYIKIIFITALIVACSAEPQRFRNSRFTKFSARQEGAPKDSATPAKAPYPAAGFKPDVPFDLPTETTTASAPIETSTAQLDSTYGPPTTYAPTTTYEPPTTETTDYDIDTEVPSEIVLEEDDDDTESVISVAVSYDNADAPEEPQRLVFGQRIRPVNDARRGPQKLRAALAEPIYFEDGSFVYSAPL